MQAYEGYFENGRFIPLGTVSIPERKRAIVTILDEPAHDDLLNEHLAAMDEFIAAIKASNEEVPEFERVNFTREVDL